MPKTSRLHLTLALILAACGTANNPPDSGTEPMGAVAAATPEAASAGIEILERGGNAIDAAVAVSFALAVTEPAGSGLGGQAMWLVHPSGRPPFVLQGTSLAPSALPEKVASEDLSGHRASTVPSTVRLLEAAWRRHGSGRLLWQQLLQPSIRLAEEGFEVAGFRLQSWRRYAAHLRGGAATAGLFLPSGDIPGPESRFRQPVLARTLKRLAQAGAEDFYQGQIATQIAQDMERNQGWIRLADLQQFPEPQEVEALQGEYRGYQVYSLPPPAGGWMVLQALRLLEEAPQQDLSRESEERWIWLAEVLRAVHSERRERPIEDLQDYKPAVDAKIGSEQIRRLAESFQTPDGGETTHFSVVDGQGMAVSATASINAYFGARAASPDLGFLYNDYMREFVLDDPQHPYALRPAGKPYSSMSATILARQGRPLLALGSPGSSRIISAVVQVVQRWAGMHQDIQWAVRAPRLHVTVPNQRVYFENDGLPSSLLLQLELRGFRPFKPLSSFSRQGFNPYFGGVHAVAWEDGGWIGAADPRRDGQALIARRRE